MKTNKLDYYLFEDADLDIEDGDKEPNDTGDQFVDITIGDGDDKFQEKIPKSTLGIVVSFIRELLRDQMDPDDVIKLILTDPRVASRSKEDVDLIKEILKALKEKYTGYFINKIPVTFPFLAAVGQTSYDISGLDKPSLDLLNASADQIGRGEIAIPLLFGISTFRDPKEKARQGTAPYDLMLGKKRCDIKDFRNEDDGELKDTKFLRLGGPAGKSMRTLGDNSFRTSKNKYLSELRVDVFSGMKTGADAILSCIKSYLHDLTQDELKVQTKGSLKRLVGMWTIEVLNILDTAVQQAITEKYDGGFFTIDTQKIELVPGDGFEFYACKSSDQRIIITKATSDIFRKGLLNQLNKMFDEEVIGYLEREIGTPLVSTEIGDNETIIAPRPEKKPEAVKTDAEQDATATGASTETAPTEELTEAILRRLLKISRR